MGIFGADKPTTWERIEKGSYTVDRRPVPGGWLYMTNGGQGEMSTTFVPDPKLSTQGRHNPHVADIRRQEIEERILMLEIACKSHPSGDHTTIREFVLKAVDAYAAELRKEG